METAWKPPKTRWVGGAVVLLGLPVCLFAVRTTYPQRNLILVGLGLDVLGALVLAIPDVHLVSQYFYTGRLRHGLLTANDKESGYSGLSDPNSSGFAGAANSEGFFEVIETMSDLYDDRALGEDEEWKDISLLMPISKTKQEIDGDSSEVAERKFVAFDDDNNRLITVDAVVLLSAIRRRIERIEGRFRRGGLFILVSGFVVQILAQLL